MNLRLDDDGGGPRHFLDGRPVRCGTQLRLRITPAPDRGFVRGPEEWVWARYEANLQPERVSVSLHTVFGIVIPTEDTVLRWPTEAER